MNLIFFNNKRNIYFLSFTLIEVLVVISILGVLSTFFYSNYNEVRKKTRDAQRKSDLKQIQKALEIYKQNQSIPVFPTPTGNPPYLASTNDQWIDSETNVVYMNKLPADPLSLTTPTPYFYKSPRIDNDSSTFLLCACLENNIDQDGNSCDAGGTELICNFNCNTNWCYKVIEP